MYMYIASALLHLLPLRQHPVNLHLHPLPLPHPPWRRSSDDYGNLPLLFALDGVLVRRQPQRGRRGLHAPLAVGERVRDGGEAAVHVRALGQEHPVVQPALTAGPGRPPGERLVPALRPQPRTVERPGRRGSVA